MGLGLTQVSAVRAQDADGAGIRLGDFVLHTSLGSDVGYVSNVYYSDNPEGSVGLRINPRLELKSVAAEDRAASGPPAVAVKAGAGASFQKYFSTSARESIGAGLGLDVTLNPERPVSFVIEESFQRSATPFTESGLPKGSTATAPDYGRNINALGGHLILQSRGGLLEGKIGYRWGRDWFDSPSFESNDSTTHTMDLNTSWEFLPKTALFYEAAVAMQRYDTAGSVVATVSDNNTLSTRIGINGGLSPKFGGTLAVGYSAGFYDSDQDLEGITLNAEGRYVPDADVEVALGYERAFSQAFQGGFVGRHRIYTRARLAVAKRLLLGGKVGVEFLKFGADPLQGNRERKDTRLFAEAGAEYRFLSWLAVTSQFGFLADITDFKYTVPTGAGTSTTDDASYTAFEAWLGIRAFY